MIDKNIPAWPFIEFSKIGNTHPRDAEYFTEYPAPIMSGIHEGHFGYINSTITFFGPMLYFLVRALKCERVLEIGTFMGYTSYYLANAVKDNAIRLQLEKAMYYGVEIDSELSHYTRTNLNRLGLPNKIKTMDSINLCEHTFEGIQFDLIFQDGAHDTEHVLHEFDTLWPQLKGNGRGYWIAHDCYGPAEEGFLEMVGSLDDAELLRFDDLNYGLAVIRKMDGYDYSRKHWPG